MSPILIDGSIVESSLVKVSGDPRLETVVSA
jgi:hypothetical protein